jgi:hypothetical protein
MVREIKPLGRPWSVAAWAALFILCFILCDRLLYTGLRFALSRYFGSIALKAVPRAPARGSGKGEALIFGTSRAEQGFNAEVLSALLGYAVRNEAAAGRNAQFHYYYYQSVKNRFPAPKVVIYGLDYFMFEKNSLGLRLVRIDQKTLFARLSPSGAVNPASALLSRVSWLFRMKPQVDELLTDILSSSRGAGTGVDLDEAAGPEQEPGVQGPGSRLIRFERRVYTQKPRKWKTRPYVPFPGLEGRFFSRLIKELDEAGIPTFLVFLPEYIGTYETNFEQEKFRGDIGRLVSGLKNVRILDFDSPQAFPLAEPSLFWNGGWGYSNSHLNERGASEFSQALGAAVRKSLAGAGPPP